MQKLSIVAILLALCLTQTYGHRSYGRTLLQGGALSRGDTSSRSRGGRAGASARVRSSGGSSRASASGTGEAFAASKSLLIKYTERVFNQITFKVFRGGSKKDFCVSAFSLIHEFVIAYGKASARAFASTAASVDIEGRGSGCASAYADARASAEAYAGIVGEAIAEARISRDHKSKARISYDVLIEVLVQAFAESHSEACSSREGYANAYQTTHARAIAYPIAKLWVWLFAGVDCVDERTFAAVVGHVDATVRPDTRVEFDDKSNASPGAEASTNGLGGAAATQPCRNVPPFGVCCSPEALATGQCTCLPDAPCNAILLDDFRRLWLDRVSGDSCHC